MLSAVTEQAGAPAGLSAKDFDALRVHVRELTGIVLADSKRTMLESRLLSRLRALKLASFAEYRALLESPGGRERERQAFINAVTTNKTSFFREAHQFDFMAREWVPAMVRRAEASGQRRLRVWSAACSTGEEPWTIAMVLRECLPSPDLWDVKILASDIDTEVLARAERGVYDSERIEGLSRERLGRHFVVGRGEASNALSIADPLRRWVVFRRLNFMDPQWAIQTRFDLVMCRNASIYFDQPTQRTLFGRIAGLLEPGGTLCVGHAEVLHWPELGLSSRPGGIYQLGGATQGRARPTPAPPPTLLPPPVAVPKPAALPQVVINVGELHASAEPVEIKTLLGSCVAACLYDPVSGVGGMNHFLLPDSTDSAADPARFGVHAMEMLINALMKAGADRRRLKGKLFGGGNVLGSVSQRPTVGERNSAFAREFLEREGIELVSERLASDCGTEVRFWPHTGRAFIKDISTSLLDLAKERTSIKAAPKGGDVELF